MKVWMLTMLSLAMPGSTTACSAPGAELPDLNAEPGFGGDTDKVCRQIDGARFVGRRATVALAAEARDLAGASAVRWLVPDQAVTMEFRADRLNIALDRANAVVGLRCG